MYQRFRTRGKPNFRAELVGIGLFVGSILSGFKKENERIFFIEFSPKTVLLTEFPYPTVG